jgi:replication factor C subunit 3/5
VRLYAEKGDVPHLLLHGPPGTGKTCSAHAVLAELYGPATRAMSLMINASDDRGFDIVQGRIRDFVNAKTIVRDVSKPKMVVLDECDAMTHEAQSALRSGASKSYLELSLS